MEKQFDDWNEMKKKMNLKDSSTVPYFKEREVWFCTIGCNIGYEEDGSSEKFWRPVLILKKFNGHLFIGIPLTSKSKPYNFYYNIGYIGHIIAFALLQQIKPFSSKSSYTRKKDFRRNEKSCPRIHLWQLISFSPFGVRP